MPGGWTREGFAHVCKDRALGQRAVEDAQAEVEQQAREIAAQASRVRARDAHLALRLVVHAINGPAAREQPSGLRLRPDNETVLGRTGATLVC